MRPPNVPVGLGTATTASEHGMACPTPSLAAFFAFGVIRAGVEHVVVDMLVDGVGELGADVVADVVDSGMWLPQG